MKCVKCGHEMLDHSTAQTICLECPNCGWGFATTLSQPLNEDMTDYEIYGTYKYLPNSGRVYLNNSQKHLTLALCHTILLPGN